MKEDRDSDPFDHWDQNFLGYAISDLTTWE